MTRGRALLRNYVATPEAVEPRPAALPVMRGNKTMSAPARPDLWLVEETAEATPTKQTAPRPLSRALLGAAPVPQPLRRRRAQTMVPSALDAHTYTTLSEDHDWFGAAAQIDGDLADDEWTMDDDTFEVEAPAELPRVLGAVVELGVFFAGLGIGLAVQGVFAWAVWTALV